MIREFKVTVDNHFVSSPHRDQVEELIARCLDGKVIAFFDFTRGPRKAKPLPLPRSAPTPTSIPSAA